MFSASNYKGDVTFSFKFPGLLTNAGLHPAKAYIYYDYVNSDLYFSISRVRFSQSAPSTYDVYFDTYIRDVDTITFDSNGYRALYFIFSVSWEGSSTAGTISGANVVSVSSFVTGYPENSFLLYTLSVQTYSGTHTTAVSHSYRYFIGYFFGTPQWRNHFTGSVTLNVTPPFYSHNLIRSRIVSDAAGNLFEAVTYSSFGVSHALVRGSVTETFNIGSAEVLLSFKYTTSITNSFGISFSAKSGSLNYPSSVSVLSYPYPYTAPAITYISYSSIGFPNLLKWDDEIVVKHPITFSYINNMVRYTLDYAALVTSSNLDDVLMGAYMFVIPTSLSNFKTTISFDVYPNNTAIQTAEFGTSVSFLASAGTVNIPISVSIPAILKTANVSIDNPGDFSTTAGTGVEVRDLVVQNTGNITLTFSGVRVAIDDGNWVVDTLTPGYTFNPPGGFSFDVYFYPNGPVDYSQSIIFTFSFNYLTNYGNVLSGVFYKSVSFHAVATGATSSSQVGISVSTWNVDSPSVVMVGKYVTGSFSITASATNNQIAQVTLTSSTPNLYFTTVSGVSINNLHATAVNSLMLQVAPGASLSVYTQWYMNMAYTASAPDVTISVTSSNATEMNGVPGLTEVKRSHSLMNPARYANLNIGIFSLSAYGPFYQSTSSILPFPYSFSLGGINVVRNIGLAWLDFYPTSSTHSEMYVKLTMSLTGSALNVHSVVTSSYFSDFSNFEWEVNNFQHTLFSSPYGYFLHIKIRPTSNAYGTQSNYVYYGTFIVSWSMSLISHINEVSVASFGQGYSNDLSFGFDHTVFYEVP